MPDWLVLAIVETADPRSHRGDPPVFLRPTPGGQALVLEKETCSDEKLIRLKETCTARPASPWDTRRHSRSGHDPELRRRAAMATPVLCRALRRDWSAALKCGAKLVSRVEPQLAEDAREVTLNRAGGNEEALGDLAVGEALAGKLGDAALAGRQRVEPRENDPARTRAGGSELGLGLVGERSGA